MKFKYFIYLILTFFFITSCGTIKEGFTNQKKNSSDEFLVEKKSPLVLPPDFGDLPEPSSKNKKNTKINNFKDLISKKKNTNILIKNNNDLEGSILDKIKSN